MLQHIVLLGAAINLVGTVPYLRDTLSGDSKPNRVTFLMWSVAPLIGTVAALSDGVRWSVLPVFMAGFCPFTIFLAAFRNRESRWQLGRFDYACGALSALALVVWGATHRPILGIVLAITSDACAALPTIRKSWTDPQTETPSAYAAMAVASATSFPAIPVWRFSEYAFPAYLTAIGLALFLIITARKPFVVHPHIGP
jgi:hypothetical protein